MSTSGRNPLDRLAPPQRRAPEVAPDSPTHESPEPDEPAADPWGIRAMPAWLDAEPTSATGDEPDDDLDDLDDDGRHPGRRFAIAPPAALALLLIAVIACVIAGLGLLRDPQAGPIVAFDDSAGPTSAEVPAASSPPPSATATTVVVVSVVGLVHRPGLVRLAPGARIADAIARAGGPRKGADLLSLNLAQMLHDGDQILVGYAGGEGQQGLKSAVVAGAGNAATTAPTEGVPTDGSRPSAAPGSAGAKVNLNSATEAQLDELPGVGPVTAKAIIEWRGRNGRFTSVDQLGEVDGIGPTRLAKLKDLVTV